MKTYIDFLPAQCRDCYQCLKQCPIKAIKLINHQARIINDRCILCGRCTGLCPQNAKTVHSDVENVKALLDSGKKIIASVDPSFIASFGLKDFSQMEEVLKKLGFYQAEESAVGAAAVAAEYLRLLKEGTYKNLISSSCPAINRMIQQFYPDAIKYLAPVEPPMVVHGKMLKKAEPDAFVIYIGPCIAKKREADEYDAVDYVLTFDELASMMTEKRIRFSFGDIEPAKHARGASARAFPIGGGVIRSFSELPKEYEYVAVEHIEKCMDVLSNIESLDHVFIEMNSCKFGCINGPCSLIRVEKGIEAELKIMRYSSAAEEDGVDAGGIDMSRRFEAIPSKSETPSEAEIKKILAEIGKFTKEDELNCGACGYSTCREKAWAVANGYSEAGLCIPYNRSKAESLSSEVIRRMPYGILVLNKDFMIETVNEAAKKLLGINSDRPEGKQFFDFINIPEFILAQADDTNILNKRIEIKETGKVTEASIIILKEHRRLLGIFEDVTDLDAYNEKIRQLRQETYRVTDEVVKKQMRIAQEIASLLGETTAETKVALMQLKKTMQNED